MKSKQKKTDVLELFFPPGMLEEFEISDYSIKESPEAFGEIYTIELTEKSIVPRLPAGYENRPVRQKGFTCKEILDFPIRGRKAVLLIRRRKWKVEGYPGILMKEIELTDEGVKLSREFAFFFEGND